MIGQSSSALTHSIVSLWHLSTLALLHCCILPREQVWSVSWSLRSEFELVTGDSYGQVRVWDIRTSGCLHVLDQYCTTTPKPPSEAELAAMRAAQEVADRAAAASAAAERTAAVERAAAERALAAAAERAALDDQRQAKRARTVVRSRQPEHIPPPRCKSIGSGLGSLTLEMGGGPGSANGRSGSTTRSRPTSRMASSPSDITASVTPMSPPSPVPASLRSQGAVMGKLDGSPGLASSAVRAHSGAVSCVMPTPDGLYWLTAGTDSSLRLWDAMHWHNRLVNYSQTHNHAIRARQLAVGEEGLTVFHPSGSMIQVGRPWGRGCCGLLTGAALSGCAPQCSSHRECVGVYQSTEMGEPRFWGRTQALHVVGGYLEQRRYPERSGDT